jgi:uncharacterized protein (DUF488 family)
VLHRQQALLAILQQVGGEASTLQIMKWAFLLGQETPSHGGKTFYQFIPYRYGPFSFTLNRETDALVRNGLVEKTGQSSWHLTSYGHGQQNNLPKSIIQDVTSITQQYGQLSGAALIDAVYAKYPWFTVNSDLPGRRNIERPTADLAIYTAGYEGKTVDEFLNLLMRSGIRRFIDVRRNPVSRRYGFHKSTLQKICSSLDIDYQHFPGLGISSAARTDLHSTESYTSLFENYREDLPNRGEDLEAVQLLLQSKPSVLVCMEANPQYCHRNVLAYHLTGVLNLPIQHLGYES